MKKILLLFLVFCLFVTSCKEQDYLYNIEYRYNEILNNFDLSAQEKCNRIVNLFIEKYDIKTALCVSIKNENIDFYENYGLTSLSKKTECSAESLHYVYSITKTFTSALVLTLVENGLLNLDGSIEYYLPELFTENYCGTKNLLLYINKDATVKELLNHTSGIYDFAKIQNFIILIIKYLQKSGSLITF